MKLHKLNLIFVFILFFTALLSGQTYHTAMRDTPTGNLFINNNTFNLGFNSGPDTGIANAYIVTLPVSPASYQPLMPVYFIPANTNTGPSTINVNGLGVVNIYSNGAPALFGTLIAGIPIGLMYDGFEFQTIAGGGGGGSGFSAGGDLTGTSASQEVIGLQNHHLPAFGPAAGYLYWNGLPGNSLTLNNPVIPTSASWPNAGICPGGQFVTTLTNGAPPSCGTPAGGGNVSGSGSSVVGDFAAFGNTSSTNIHDSGYSPSSFLPSTTALPSNTPATAHNFFTAYNSATGNFSTAQPQYSDLGGTVPTWNQDTTGTAALADNLTGTPTVIMGQSITQTSPQCDIRSYGAVIDGSTDILPYVQSCINQFPSGGQPIAGHSSTILLPCAGIPGTGTGCYISDTTKLTFATGDNYTLLIQGNLSCGTGCWFPSNFAVIQGSGSSGGVQFQNGAPATLSGPTAYGTLGTAIPVAGTATIITPTFTAGSMSNLVAGSAITVAQIGSATATAVRASTGYVTLTLATALRIPPGENLTVTGCSDSSVNIANEYVTSDDYPLQQIVYYTNNSTPTTATGCTVSGLDDDKFESMRVLCANGTSSIMGYTGCSAGQITVVSNFTHLSTDQWGEVAVGPPINTSNPQSWSDIVAANCWGMCFWAEGSTIQTLTRIGTQPRNAVTSGSMEQTRTYDVKMHNLSLLSTHNNGTCPGGGCVQASYPYALICDNDPGGLFYQSNNNGCDQSIIDDRTTVFGGIKIGMHGGGTSTGINGFPTIRGILLEEPPGTAIILDNRANGAGGSGCLVIDNPWIQDNILGATLYDVGYTDARNGSGCVELDNASSVGSANITNKYFNGRLIENNVAQAFLSVPNNSSSSSGVYNLGNMIQGEIAGLDSSLGPAVLPFGTLPVNDSTAYWTSQCATIPSCTVTVVPGPDGKSSLMGAAELDQTSTAGSITIGTASLSTYPGDWFIFRSWIKPGSLRTFAWLSQNSGTPFGLSSGSDTFYNYNFTSNQTGCIPFSSSLLDDYRWYPQVCVTKVNTGNSTAHNVNFFISPGVPNSPPYTFGNGNQFSQPCWTFIPGPNNPSYDGYTTEVDVQRAREQMYHGDCPSNVSAGTAATVHPIQTPSIVSISAISQVVSAPSGACTAPIQDQQVISTGTIYTCQGGTWGAVAGGSGSGLSGMTAGQVPIAATATTVTSSEALAGSGAAIVTGPSTSVSGDIVTYTGVVGQTQDSGTLLTSLAPKASPTFTGTVTGPFTVAGVVTTTAGGVLSSSNAPTISAANMTSFPTLNQSTTGNAATATNISTNGTSLQVWGMNSGATAQGWQTIGSTGITSIAIAVPSSLLTVSGSPLIANGTITLGLQTASANTIFGNWTGSTAAPNYNSVPSCSATGNVLQELSGTGLTCHTIASTDIPTLNQSTTGNASTASALASTPTACSAGQAPTGISANGNAQGCTTYEPTLTFSSPLVNTSGTITAPTVVTSAASLTANELMIGSGSQGSQTIALTGYVYGNGTSIPTASTTIPVSAVSGISATLPITYTAGVIAAPTAVTSAASLTSNDIMTGAGLQASQTTALQIVGSVIQNATSTTTVEIQGGQNVSSSSALGGVLLHGANQTGAGGTNSAGGGIDLSGGNNAGTSGTSQAGSVELEAGESSAGGMQGLVVLGYQMNQGATVTQWNLQCYTGSSTMTVQDCGASPSDFVGVSDFHSGSAVEVHTPPSESPINASAAVTLYHTVCAGSTAGKITDSGGTGPCPVGSGITVGKVIAITGAWTLADGASFTASTTLPLIAMNNRATIGSGDLSASGVTAGSYTNSNFTVDAAGRVTAASNGSAAFISSLTTTGTSGNASVSSGVLNIPNYTYTLPTATSSVLGGVKPDGTSITNSSGAISCTTATTSQLGCVKVDGTTITIASGVISAAGGSGSVNVNGSSVSSPNFNGTTPAAGTGQQNVTFQVSGSNVSAELPPSGIGSRTNSTTSDTILAADRGGFVNESNAGAIAVTLPQAGTTNFGSNFSFTTCDTLAGTSTITPTTSTISYWNGSAYTSAAASLALTTGQCATIWTPDNTNYYAIVKTLNAAQPFILPAAWTTTLVANTYINTFPVPAYTTTALTITFPSGCANSSWYAATSATASTTLILKKTPCTTLTSGQCTVYGTPTTLCTATIAASATTATFSGSGGTATSGDLLQIEGGGDLTLAGFGIAFAGSRSGGL